MNFTELIISHDVIKALGWTLIHSLWQGIIIIGVTAFVLYLLRKSRASLRYFVLCLAMVAVAVFTVVTFLVVTGPAPADRQLEVSGALAMGMPVADGSANVTPEGPSSTRWIELVTSTVGSFIESHSHMMVMGWFLGVMFFLLKYAGGLYYIGVMRRKGRPLQEAGWQDVALQIARRSGLRKRINILESALVKVPVTIGHLKPVILFPLGMISRIPPDQVEAILMHEIAHIVRRDYLVNLIQSFMEAIFFYHPVVWWISRRIRMERENICDDMALNQSVDPITYIKALTTMEELSAKAPVMAPAITGRKKHLLNRIKRMVQPDGTRSRGTEGWVTLLVLFMVVFLIGAGTNLNALRAGAPSGNGAGAIHPDAISSLSASSFSSPTSQEDIFMERHALEPMPPSVPNLRGAAQDRVIIPDTVKDEQEQARQKEAEYAKQQALQMLEQAKQQQKQAMMEYQEALEKYNDVLRELGEVDWQKDFKWVFVDSLDSVHVMVMPDLKDVYFYGEDHFNEPLQYYDHKPGSYSYKYHYKRPGKIEILEDDGEMEVIIKDLEDDFVWNIEKDFDIDVDVDVDREIEKEMQAVERQLKEQQKQFEKQVFITRPDVRGPRQVQEPRVFVHRPTRSDQIMRQELMEDGLVRPGKEYIVELGPDSMYINGEKQSRGVYKKYKKIYEGVTDEEVTQTVKLIF